MKPNQTVRFLGLSALLISPHCLTAATFNASIDSDYGKAGNWTPSGVPSSAEASIQSTHHVVSSASQTTTGRLLMGNGSGNNSSLTVTGGTLTFGGNDFTSANYVGVGGGSATLTLNGGNFTSSIGALFIGANNNNSTGVVNVHAGSSLTLTHASNGDLALANNAAGTASLNIYGGSVSVGDTLYGGYNTGNTSNISITSGSSLSSPKTNFGRQAGTTNLFLTVNADNWNTINWGALTIGSGTVNLNLTLTGNLSDWTSLTNDELAIWQNTGGNLSSANLTLNNQVAGLGGSMNLTTGIYTIPEPSAALLGGLGTLLLLRRRTVR